MEACVGAHHLSRKLQMLGHDARLMPAKYVRPYSKGQKNDFRDAEAVQRPIIHRPGREPVLGALSAIEPAADSRYAGLLECVSA